MAPGMHQSAHVPWTEQCIWDCCRWESQTFGAASGHLHRACLQIGCVPQSGLQPRARPAICDVSYLPPARAHSPAEVPPLDGARRRCWPWTPRRRTHSAPLLPSWHQRAPSHTPHLPLHTPCNAAPVVSDGTHAMQERSAATGHICDTMHMRCSRRHQQQEEQHAVHKEQRCSRARWEGASSSLAVSATQRSQPMAHGQFGALSNSLVEG